MKTKKHISDGFSIVELLVVLVIIAIIATMTTITYNGIQVKAIDTATLNDLNKMNAAEQKYIYNSGAIGKAYYSANGLDSDLGFLPSNGSVVDVVVGNSIGYCIRAYNPKGSYNSIDNAYTKESATGVCASKLGPSVAAITDDYAASKIINGSFEVAPTFVANQTSSGKWVDGTAAGSATKQQNYLHASFGGAGASKYVKFDSVNYHSGSYGLMIHIDAGGYSEVRSNSASYYAADGMALLPNTNYKFTGWMKSESVTGASASGQTIKLLFANSSGVGANVTYVSPAGSGTSTEFTATDIVAISKVWTQYTSTFTTGPDVAWFHPEYRVYGHTGAATLAGNFWYDDVSVVRN